MFNKIVIKALVTIVIIASIVFIYLLTVPLTHHIDKTVTALMVCGANTEETEVEITINGSYITQLFKDDIFEGQFIIDGFDITKNYLAYINISDINLLYRSFGGSYSETYGLGNIYTDKVFNQFIVIPYPQYIENPSYKGDAGYILDAKTLTAICYPVQTRAEAVELVNNKLGKYPDFHMN